MDFALVEVYLGDSWHTFDARNNPPHRARPDRPWTRRIRRRIARPSVPYPDSFRVWADEVTQRANVAEAVRVTTIADAFAAWSTPQGVRVIMLRQVHGGDPASALPSRRPRRRVIAWSAMMVP